MTTSTDSIEQRLEALTAEDRWSDTGRLHGVEMSESTSIDFEIPEGMKLQVRVSEDAGDLTIYRSEGGKHDDPGYYHMPNGTLSTGEYAVTGIRNSENGVQVGIGGRGFFYLPSLDGLAFDIVEKDDVELANERIKPRLLEDYELNQLKIQELQEAADAARALVERLPVFDVASTHRYSMNCDAGIEVALYENGEVGDRSDSYHPRKSRLHGKFHGNRFEVIGDRLALIDDGHGLAAWPVVDLDTKMAYGFGWLKAVDANDTFERKTQNAEFKERLQSTPA